MNVQEITTLITTVGFPIVCCGAMFWNMIQTNKQHKEEMDKMSDAINNNTIALQKLVDSLGVERDA